MKLEAKSQQAIAAYDKIGDLVEVFQKQMGIIAEELLLAMIAQETAELKKELDDFKIKNTQLAAKHAEVQAQYHHLQRMTMRTPNEN